MKTSLKNPSIMLTWFISYCLMLLVPILIGTIIYVKAEDIVEKEIINVNTARLKQSQQAVDNGIDDVKRFVYQVMLDKKLQRLSRLTPPIKNTDYYSVYEVLSNLSNYKSVTAMISSYYIYLKNSDKVLSGSGLADKEVFYNRSLTSSTYNLGLSYDDWVRLVKGEHKTQYMQVDTRLKNEEKPSPAVIYTQPLYSDGMAEPDATLIVKLDNKRFQQSIPDFTSLDDGWTLLLNDDGNILFSTIPSGIGLDIQYEELSKSTDIIYPVINGTKYAVSYITSNTTAWKYILIVPASIFKQKVKYISDLTLFCLLLCLVFGAFAAFIFTKMNYNPVNEIMRVLKKKFGDNLVKDKNEYRFIQMAMNSTLSENERINLILKQQNVALQSSFLQQLLKGKQTDLVVIDSALTNYDIHFDSDRFAVMLMYIKDFDALFLNDEKIGAMEKIKLVQFIIANVVEELVRQNNGGYVFEVDDMMACLINLRQTADTDAKQDMVRIAKEAKEFLGSKFAINLMFSFSAIHHALWGIPEAYHESLSVMEYKKTMDNESLLSYDELNITNGYFDYTIETEYKLINYIKAGEFKHAEELLNDIFEINFSKTTLSNDLIKCLMFDLVNTMLKTLPEINCASDGAFLRELDIANRLLKCEKIYDMKRQMVDIFRMICDYIQQNKAKKDTFINNVINYVNENYNDANISVSVIAGKFKLTPSYLTRLFKEQTGSCLLDYMAKVRIDKAKQLLKEGRLDIKDVAGEVGYFNIGSFIRTFKKLEGVTPGAYKDMA